MIPENEMEKMIEQSFSEDSAPIEENATEEALEVTEANTTAVEEDDEDDITIVGINKDNINTTDDDNMTQDEVFRQMLNVELANMKKNDSTAFKSKSSEILADIIAYRKDLMINEGLTSDEADRAARKRLKRNASNAETAYKIENPENVDIVINKENSDKLEFTEEEKSKLARTKTIHLVEVENRELETLKIKQIADRKERLSIIRKKSCSLANHSLPFYNTLDYITFNGATIYQLLSAVKPESQTDADGNRVPESLYSSVFRKAQFLYEHFLSSTTIEKFDTDDNIQFTFEDFISWFNYYDIDTGIYAIYVASSTEMITSGFLCNSFTCKNKDNGKGKEFEATFNTKGVINYDNAGDYNKEVIDAILDAKDNIDKMKKVQEKYTTSKRIKSTFTGNCYDIKSPSIADMLLIFSVLEGQSNDIYVQEFAGWTHTVDVNLDDTITDNNTYMDIDELGEIIDYYKSLVETEKTLLTIFMAKLLFVPRFIINTTCPHCGQKSQVELSMDDMVFQRARSTEAAIEM